jgi:glycosyltransferase involved in cell wall biosynthesis
MDLCKELTNKINERKKMNIIHVTQFLGIGGLEKIIFHLALEQQGRGHDVQIYVYDHNRAWVDFFKEHGLKVITPPMKNAGYDFKLLKRMSHDLKKADIIHTHDLNPLMYLGPLAFMKKLFFQKFGKIIHTTHGLDHIKNYRRAKLYERIVSRLSSKHIAVSEKIAHFYKEELHLSPKKVIVIENGVASYKGCITTEMRQKKKQWLCERHGLNPQLPIILSLSRIVPLKDQLFLIKALKKRPQYQLIVAGPAGDPHYYDQIEQEADSSIKIVGPQSDIISYNMGADLYISASTHEGIPVAVLEALSVETPCLVSDIPGHATLNQYGELVTLFQISDIENFLKKCDQILKDSSLKDDQTKEARRLVENHFSTHQMADQYSRIYQS